MWDTQCQINSCTGVSRYLHHHFGTIGGAVIALVQLHVPRVSHAKYIQFAQICSQGLYGNVSVRVEERNGMHEHDFTGEDSHFTTVW